MPATYIIFVRMRITEGSKAEDLVALVKVPLNFIHSRKNVVPKILRGSSDRQILFVSNDNNSLEKLYSKILRMCIYQLWEA